METYVYTAKPDSVIVDQICKDEFEAIRKMPKLSFDITNGNESNKQDIALKKLFDAKELEITKAIDGEFQRVLKNLRDIPLNSIVSLNNTTRIQRVPSGWIYLNDIYDNTMSAQYVTTTSTFVPIN